MKKAQLRTDFPFGCDRGGGFHVGPNSETGPALSPAQDSPLAMGSSIYPCPALAEYLRPYAQLACDCSRAGRLPRKLLAEWITEEQDWKQKGLPGATRRGL